MGKVDLHMHTKCSDGVDTVEQLLINAQKAGLEWISITDHNTCYAYQELSKMHIKEYYTGKLVTGTEIRTIVDGYNIEVLGYNVDVELMNEVLPNRMPTFAQLNQNEAKELIKILKNMGYMLHEDKIRFDPETQSGQLKIVEELLSHPENQRFLQEFDGKEFNNAMFHKAYITNPKSKFFIDSSKLLPSIEEVIALIKKAGGLVFLPHIFEYGDNAKMLLEKLTSNYPIDGVECYYSEFTEEQTKFLEKFCEERKLLKSGGTDYHGEERRAGVKLGEGRGNLNISSEVITNWAIDKSQEYIK